MIGGPGPEFSYPDGPTGAGDYASRGGGTLVPRTTADLMSYGRPRDGISDYHFTKALNFRLTTNGGRGAAVGAEPPMSARPSRLALMTGVHAPPVLPDSVHEDPIAGRNFTAWNHFLLGSNRNEVADGDGYSSLVCVLPVRPRWEWSLANITLSGPGGGPQQRAGKRFKGRLPR